MGVGGFRGRVRLGVGVGQARTWRRGGPGDGGFAVYPLRPGEGCRGAHAVQTVAGEHEDAVRLVKGRG